MHGFAGADEGGELARFGVGDVDINEDDMGAEAFAGEACGECGVCDAGVVVCLFCEDGVEDIGDFLVCIDDEDPCGACGDAFHGDVVGLHEAVEFGYWYPAVFGPWDSVSFELA